MPKKKKDKSGLTCQLPEKTAANFAEDFERAAQFWKSDEPKSLEEYDEEMKKFTQGFAYKAPGKEWTKCKEKLPGDLQHVLVLCGGCWGGDSYDPLRQVYSFMIFQAYFHSSSGWHFMGGVQNCKVFAWREIPHYPHEWLEEFKNHG